MSEENMRSEFEAAAEDHFWLQELSGEYDDAEQQYLDETVQTAWEFWQLSREALQAECEKLVEALGRVMYCNEVGFLPEDVQQAVSDALAAHQQGGEA